ncbi:unnamed protein product [Scytosiphon promiscuus]
MASIMPRAGSATSLMWSLCSLMPISITLAACSLAAAGAPTAAAGTSSSSSKSAALGARGGGRDKDRSGTCAADGGAARGDIHKHSFRSTGHPTVPHGLLLKQMVVICRHGDRAPVANSVGTLLDGGPESIKLWNSKLPPQEQLNRWSKAFPRRVLGENFGQTIDEICATEYPWGQLTFRGAEELRMVGEGLRGILDGGEAHWKEGVMPGEGGRLFPAGLDAEKSSIFVRCSRVPRTQQSAQNMLIGLGVKGGVDLHVRPKETETMMPVHHTRARRSAIIAELDQDNESVYPGYAELRAKAAEVAGVSEEELKWTSTREVLSCYEAHGVPLPPGAASSGAIDKVVSFTSWMWGRWFGTREMARLSLGPFLQELLTMLGARGQETGIPEAGMPSTPKLAIFSGHDTTLLPILAAFQIYDNAWPPYASYISLDVAENKQGERLVRVVFNGKEAVLPGAEGAWIPLLELQERLEDVMPIPEDAMESDPGDNPGAESSEISAAVSGGGGAKTK